MTFKESIESDLDVFLDPDIFGELHNVNGKDIVIVISNHHRSTEEAETATTRTGIVKSSGSTRKMNDRTAMEDVTIHGKTSDLGNMATVGAKISIDGEKYIIRSAKDSMGMSSISLGRLRI
jgi:hypothetical protein